MSYKRRRGLGGGRGAKGRDRTAGQAPQEPAGSADDKQPELAEGTAAAAAPPSTATLAELFFSTGTVPSTSRRTIFIQSKISSSFLVPPKR